jgi:hypothetical protein
MTVKATSNQFGSLRAYSSQKTTTKRLRARGPPAPHPRGAENHDRLI